MRFLIAALLIMASPALAGTTYQVDERMKGIDEWNAKLSVSCDERRCRIERESGVYTIDVRGAARTIAVDPSEKTYWTSDRGKSSHLFDLPFPGAKVSDLKVELNGDGDPGNRKSVLKISYGLSMKIGGEKVNAMVTAAAFFTTTTALDPNLMPESLFHIRTGLLNVDAEVREKIGSIPGFMIHRILTVTRTITGGKPYTMILTTEVSGFESRESSDDLFAIPRGYRDQPPVIGVSGR